MSDLYDIAVDKIDGTATNLGEHCVCHRLNA